MRIYSLKMYIVHKTNGCTINFLSRESSLQLGLTVISCYKIVWAKNSWVNKYWRKWETTSRKDINDIPDGHNLLCNIQPLHILRYLDSRSWSLFILHQICVWWKFVYSSTTCIAKEKLWINLCRLACHGIVQVNNFQKVSFI